MGSITTAFPTTFKQELAQGMHCFTGPVNFTANTNSNNTLSGTGVGNTANLCRGMTLSAGGDIPGPSPPCVIVDFPNANSITIFPAATATHTSQSLTANGDVFNVALLIPSPTNNYAGNWTNSAGSANIACNYSSLGADEITGAGYTAGGLALSVNTTPNTNISLTTGTTAFWSWSINPSWAPSASFSTGGCIFYNTSTRNGATTATGRAVYVGSFGGTQTVTGGTFTLVLPTNNASNAILRIQ